MDDHTGTRWPLRQTWLNQAARQVSYFYTRRNIQHRFPQIFTAEFDPRHPKTPPSIQNSQLGGLDYWIPSSEHDILARKLSDELWNYSSSLKAPLLLEILRSRSLSFVQTLELVQDHPVGGCLLGDPRLRLAVKDGIARFVIYIKNKAHEVLGSSPARDHELTSLIPRLQDADLGRHDGESWIELLEAFIQGLLHDILRRAILGMDTHFGEHIPRSARPSLLPSLSEVSAHYSTITRRAVWQNDILREDIISTTESIVDRGGRVWRLFLIPEDEQRCPAMKAIAFLAWILELECQIMELGSVLTRFVTPKQSATSRPFAYIQQRNQQAFVVNVVDPTKSTWLTLTPSPGDVKRAFSVWGTASVKELFRNTSLPNAQVS